MQVGGQKIKRSSQEALNIIHRMIFDPEYPHSELVKQEFRAYDVDTFSLMDLGKHFNELAKNQKSADKKTKNND